MYALKWRDLGITFKVLQSSPGCIELDKSVSLGDRGGKRGGREDMKSCFNHSLNRAM